MRKLDDKKNKDHFSLLLASTIDPMRGYDYRARKTGISMVVMKPFPNQRAAYQGLMRVGRFNDECERLIIKGTEIIDAKLNEKY